MPRNARRHPDAQIERIAKSIQRFGWGRPVLAREDGTIIAGHGAVEAARRIGMTSVPVRVMPLGPKAAAEFAAVDNALGEQSSWDDALLAEVAEAGDAELRDLLRGGDIDGADSAPAELEELEVDDQDVDFWIVVRGPLRAQPDVLEALTKHLESIRDVEVEIGGTS